ncbi:hypothetical protein AB0K21_21675 [Streptosporangium sp. NPDC049248]|uniref:3'-5' exonuclease n=1 Tax=Streptosporangium sp. NPDC049248 TaxID=3155651 RepID=UPI003426D493
MTKYVILDIETTSLDRKLGDLWEVATITYDTARPEGGYQEWWWQVRPNLCFADPKALQISRYYERAKMLAKEVGMGVQLATSDWKSDLISYKQGDFIENATAEEIAWTLAQQLDGAVIVANNPSFDRDFLAKFLRENGQALTASHRMEDVRVMLTGYVYGRLAAMDGDVDEAFNAQATPHVRDWLDGATNTLSWEVVGVTQPYDTRHTALGDARLVRDLFAAITRGVK